MGEYTIDAYWVALYRRKYLIVFIAIVAAVLSGVASSKITPRYEAMVVFFVPEDASAPDGGRAGAARARLPTGSQAHAKAFASILKQRDAMEEVGKRFPERTRGLSRDVDVVVPREGVIRVFVRDKDPKVAADIANAFVDYFNEFQEKLIQENTDKALGNLDAEEKQVEDRIRKASEQKKRFQEEHNIASLNTSQEELERLRARFQESLERARVDQRTTEQRIVSLQEQLAKEAEAYETGDIVLSDPVVNSLKDALSQIEVDIASREVELKPDHPEMLGLKGRHAKTKENLEREIAEVVRSRSKLTGTLYASLRQKVTDAYVERSVVEARIRGFEHAIAATEKRARLLPQLLHELDEYEETIARYRDLRTTLARSRNDLIAASLQARETAEIIEKAKPPTSPVFPRLPLNVAVAGLSGLIVGVIYALFLEHLEARRRARRLRNLELQAWARQLGEERPGRSERDELREG